MEFGRSAPKSAFKLGYRVVQRFTAKATIDHHLVTKMLMRRDASESDSPQQGTLYRYITLYVHLVVIM